MIYYNDNEPFCCEVIKARIADGLLPQGTVDDRDIKEIPVDELRRYRQIHLFCGIGGFPLALEWLNFGTDRSILTGGFPCQDLSVAGKGAGLEGKRSGLFWETVAAIDMVRPEIFILENVSTLLTRGFGTVLGALSPLGYRVEWHCVGARYVGAPHQRDRIWIVGTRNDVEDSRHLRRRGDERGAIGVCGHTQSEETIRSTTQSATTGSSEESQTLANPQVKRSGEGGDQAGQVNDRSVSTGCSGTGATDDVANPGGQGSSECDRSGRPRKSEGGTPESWGETIRPEDGKGTTDLPARCRETVANTINQGSQGGIPGGQGAQREDQQGHPGCCGAVHRQPIPNWSTTQCRLGGGIDGVSIGVHPCGGWECGLPRVAQGQKNRTKRLKALGNAIVPQVAAFVLSHVLGDQL